MTKAFLHHHESPAPQGSAPQHGPRLAGDILREFITHSHSPLARGWRRYRQAVYPCTEPCVDLKLLTLEPGRMPAGGCLEGMLTHDGDGHFLFLQRGTRTGTHEPPLRNPHVHLGHYINVNRRPDGTLYPTFCRPPYTPDFTFRHFCLAAAQELVSVAGCL